MQKNHWLIFALVTFSSLLLRLLVQPNPNFDAFHDDYMMVLNAHNIQLSGWLGDWSRYTLSKGPGYPLFLAFTGHLPWPVTITIHLIVLLALAVFLREIVFLGAPIWFALSSYAFAAFFPALFGNQMSRFYRESLLFTLALLMLALLMVLLRVIRSSLSSEQTRLKYNLRIAGLLVLIGLIIGYFYISKTSWQFLLVPLSVALLIIIMMLKSNNSLSKKKLLSLVSYSLLFVAFAAIPAVIVTSENAKHFGTPLVDDFSQGGFPRALSALMRIEDQNRPEYVDVTLAMREKAYAVSPTFTKLKPYLELPDNTGWRGQACIHLKICNESANWFNWDFRDAVANAGLATDSLEFQSTFNRIADEINAACSSGLISCGQPGITSGLRSFPEISPRLIVDAVGIGLQYIWQDSPGNFSRGTPSLSSSKEVMDTWQSTISDLGNTTPPTSSWNIGSRNIEGVLGLVSKIYSLLWPLLLLSGIVGLFLRPKKTVEDRTLRFMSISFWVATATLVLQIALFEANSGLYMILGGELYLLPVFPFVLAGTIIGNFRIISQLGRNGQANSLILKTSIT